MRASLLLFLPLLFLGSCEEARGGFDKDEEPHGASEERTSAFERLEQGRYNVALLLIDGTYNTELTAPMDIFHHTRFRKGVKAMNVFTVSDTYEPVLTFEGLQVIPDFNYLDTLPEIDILVIPAAEHNLDDDLEDEELIAFIKEIGEKADYVASHCDGAFLLAKSGLLRGRISTTFPGDVESYRAMFPALEVVEDVVLVHDGKYITSAGGAKSFEASLYLAELLYGKRIADDLAEGMVIDWDIDEIQLFKVLD